jgi:hypothetical protein
MELLLTNPKIAKAELDTSSDALDTNLASPAIGNFD